MWTGTGRQIDKRCSVLSEKLPEAERGQAAKGSSRLLTQHKTGLHGERGEATLAETQPAEAGGSPLESPGHRHCSEGKDRTAELVPH